MEQDMTDSSTQLSIINDRILRLNEIKRITGLSRSSIYALMRADKFPQRVSLSARSVGWYEGEIMSWMLSRQRVVANASPEINLTSIYNRAKTLPPVASPAAEAMGNAPSSPAYMG